jgi:Transposase DDE domain
MDRDVWALVMAAVARAARGVKPSVYNPRFADALVVATYLWTVWHDRPLCWAADRSHYGSLFRPRKLPSVSQFTRRVKTDSVRLILQAVHADLARTRLSSPVACLDGKALAVSPVSKDRDARRGRVCGGFAKGYKLHAYASEGGRLVLWGVTPPNVAEQTVAMTLVAHAAENAPQLLAPLTMADSNYDSAELHKPLAAAGGHLRLLTPLKGQGRVKGGAHHPVTLRQMGPGRRELVSLWKADAGLCRRVLRARDNVERTFGTLTCTAGGLGPLPAWVRTLERVRRWVGGKIALHHARLQVRQRQGERAVA